MMNMVNANHINIPLYYCSFQITSVVHACLVFHVGLI